MTGRLISARVRREEDPGAERERLWLSVHLVCRYERAVERAARTDFAALNASALPAENRALKARSDHLERRIVKLTRETGAMEIEAHPRIGNETWVFIFFDGYGMTGPPQARLLVTVDTRGVPACLLTSTGLRPTSGLRRSVLSHRRATEGRDAHCPGHDAMCRRAGNYPSIASRKP
jgi:hypothetical protein